MLDVTQPLRRVQRIALRKGETALVELKYERLPTFCYVCGTIGHIERDCPVNHEDDKEFDKQWGSWLRASPRKGRQRLEEETKAFLNCARTINFDGSPSSPPKETRGIHVTPIPPSEPSHEACASGPAQGTIMATTMLPADPSKSLEFSTLPSPPYTFTAGAKSGPSKTRRNKMKARVVPMDINETTLHDTLISNNCPPGDKRKFPDYMLVNDDLVDDITDVKKQKMGDVVIPGSVESHVPSAASCGERNPCFLPEPTECRAERKMCRERLVVLSEVSCAERNPYFLPEMMSVGLSKASCAKAG
ncbi:hypothetical protein BVRB_9g214320 [Beta vulgaris subsp. vulgaris]|nr:hypothetical protein BVRB_9g214320 [Beta vulgaris subsp. vulgaris]